MTAKTAIAAAAAVLTLAGVTPAQACMTKADVKKMLQARMLEEILDRGEFAFNSEGGEKASFFSKIMGGDKPAEAKNPIGYVKVSPHSYPPKDLGYGAYVDEYEILIWRESDLDQPDATISLGWFVFQEAPYSSKASTDCLVVWGSKPPDWGVEEEPAKSE